MEIARIEAEAEVSCCCVAVVLCYIAFVLQFRIIYIGQHSHQMFESLVRSIFSQPN